jgi:hypothetical protein
MNRAPARTFPVALEASYECAAFGADAERICQLGSHTSGNAVTAVIWLGWQATHLADRLSGSAARPLRIWLSDDAEHTRATEQLLAGHAYMLTASEGSFHYVLTAIPTSAPPRPRPATAGAVIHQTRIQHTGRVMHDFQPPVKRARPFEKLFTTKAQYRVQAPAECHEYKKESGSSDGAMTYDTTKI